MGAGIWGGAGPAQTMAVHADYLGTPRTITNGAAVVWKWDSTDPFGANLPSVPSVVYNLRFPGQYYDAETGLHYNHYRTYDPSLGRYLQPDPLGLAAGKNPFNYVNQSPLNAVDPEGLSPYGVKMGPNGMEWDFSINGPGNPVRQVWEGVSQSINFRGPDYIALSANFYVFSVGGAINLHNYNYYMQGGMTRSYPGYSRSLGGSLVFGSILAEKVDAKRVDSFLNGAGAQVSLFLPTPIPYIGVGGSLSYAYGGDCAHRVWSRNSRCKRNPG